MVLDVCHCGRIQARGIENVLEEGLVPDRRLSQRSHLPKEKGCKAEIQQKEAETVGFPMVRPLNLASHNLLQIMNTWMRPLRRLVKTAQQHYHGTCG